MKLTSHLCLVPRLRKLGDCLHYSHLHNTVLTTSCHLFQIWAAGREWLWQDNAAQLHCGATPSEHRGDLRVRWQTRHQGQRCTWQKSWLHATGTDNKMTVETD
jgi:hypothetical protein